MTHKNTKVKCDVNTCIHNHSHNCDLNTLNIGCTCNNKDCSNKKETICNNFSSKKD